MKHVTEIQLIEYANGSTDPQQKHYIETHLAECTACKEQFEQIASINEALGEFTVPQVSDLTFRVRRKIETQKVSSWRHMAYNIARIAAVIAISASSGYFAANSLYSKDQSYSITDLKAQAGISFAQPARHVALAASGEIR